jgi:ribulose-phosphate 3-epimerase
VHPESTQHPWRTLGLIRKAGAKAGIVLQPGTPLSEVSELLDEIDFLNVLTADPEFEGESPEGREQAAMMAAGLEKLRQARSLREQRALQFEIEAEGGIGSENVTTVAGAGADILVSGFAIFHEGQPAARLQEMIALADGSIASEPAKSRGV